MSGRHVLPGRGSRLRALAGRLRLLRPRPRRLAVVLGGGGTLGAFEVGVIDVLARRGIVPDLLVGTSIGAVNAAFWAFDPSPDVADRLLHFWLEADHSTMIPDGPIPIVGRLVQRKRYLTTQRGVARAISRATPAGATIEDSRIPLAVVTTDVAQGAKVVLRSGPLVPAVLASTAIPVLFPPVSVAGRWLVDGGVVANCDVETAVEAGMSDVLVVDVMGGGAAAGESHLSDVAESTVGVMLQRQTDLAIRACWRRARIALLRPRLATRPRLGDFDMTMQLYHWGRAATTSFLDKRLWRGLFEYDTSDGEAAVEVA